MRGSGHDVTSICAQVLQQEEQADKDWALSESATPGGPRPRRLKQRWREAVEEAADGALPQRAEFTAGQLDRYLDRLRARMVEDLGAAKRNVVRIYPEDFQPFQVRSVQTPSQGSATAAHLSPPPIGVPAELPWGGDPTAAGSQ